MLLQCYSSTQWTYASCAGIHTAYLHNCTHKDCDRLAQHIEYIIISSPVSGVFRCVLPGQTPHQSQVVFSCRNKMAAVVCELQTGNILIVTTEDTQQLTCGHLNQSQRRKTDMVSVCSFQTNFIITLIS